MSKYLENLNPNDLFLELQAFSDGHSAHAWRCFGSHPAKAEDGTEGYLFRVWAPNAPKITLIGDFNHWDLQATPMEKIEGGIWEVFVPGLQRYDAYQYAVFQADGSYVGKADPFAFHAATRPDVSSKIYDLNTGYAWGDQAWMARRAKQVPYTAPMNIYECHLGSWRRTGDGEFLSYRDTASYLVPYVKEMGFTHVELLPVTEHPLDASWGYQCTGYFAATARYGEPKQLMHLIDAAHAAGIGVILDWVPGGFCADAQGLATFNGHMLYEREIHPNWGTHKFDFGRGEVRSFLVSNVLFWIELFHADGIRMDGVSSMLYLNFGVDDPSQKKFNKYGDEGDKLLFKILNSGDFLSGVAPETLQDADANRNALSVKMCEKGLRYDLTVPFARYVVQHQNEISFPFRRYQIQPVWRADRPQKGRYREFFQCDVDIIGSRSLLNEVELIEIVAAVFKKLGIRIALKMNNRKILYGIAETIGHADKMTDITVAIDKLEKIGIEAVNEELLSKGISEQAVAALQPILSLSGTNREKLRQLRAVIGGSETGIAGIDEMETIFGYVEALGTELDIELDLSLARGLNYYTGAIFEVKAKDFAIGSICGGGRYDDLTGIFGMPGMSGVGISFGADRIYDVMCGLCLYPEEAGVTTRVLFLNFGETEQPAALRAMKQLRAAGIPCEMYPDAAKMKKQMEYANRRAIPLVVIIGSDELAAGNATVKNMATGEQQAVPLAELAARLQ